MQQRLLICERLYRVMECLIQKSHPGGHIGVLHWLRSDANKFVARRVVLSQHLSFHTWPLTLNPDLSHASSNLQMNDPNRLVTISDESYRGLKSDFVVRSDEQLL